MQASGHRFDPDRLHHAFSDAKRACDASIYLEMKRTEILVVDTGWDGVRAPLPIFDIVNGFFKSMP